MAQTTTHKDILKLNRGTKAKLDENIASLSSDDINIPTDIELPIPTEEDSGKVLGVDSNGDYELKTPTTVVVEQTYGSTSANAQSGIAVAQAISGINIFPQLDQVTVTSSTYTISSDGIYIVTASNCVVTVNSDVKYAIIHFQDSTSHEITFTGGRTIIDENLSLLEVNYSETLYCGGRTNWTLTAIDKLVLTEGADL